MRSDGPPQADRNRHRLAFRRRAGAPTHPGSIRAHQGRFPAAGAHIGAGVRQVTEKAQARLLAYTRQEGGATGTAPPTSPPAAPLVPAVKASGGTGTAAGPTVTDSDADRTAASSEIEQPGPRHGKARPACGGCACAWPRAHRFPHPIRSTLRARQAATWWPPLLRVSGVSAPA